MSSSPSYSAILSLSFLISAITFTFTSSFTTSNTPNFTLPSFLPLPSLRLYHYLYLYFHLHLYLHSISITTTTSTSTSFLEPLISMRRLYGKLLRGLRPVLKVKEKAEQMSLPQHGQNPQRLCRFLMI